MNKKEEINIEKEEESKAICLSCGYKGEDIQGKYPDLYEGYGCPKCHSPFVVIITKNKVKE